MMLMRRRRRTRSRGSSTIIRCDVAREAISAIADDEEPPVAEAITAARFHQARNETKAKTVARPRVAIRLRMPLQAAATSYW